MTTPTPRDLTLAFHDYDVPCLMDAFEPDSCTGSAAWIIDIRHIEVECADFNAPMPFCDFHKRALEMGFNKFWQKWLGVDPPYCDICQGLLELHSIEPIRKADK